MFFTPPYPFAFEPAPATLGAPMTSIASNAAIGRYLLSHFTNPTAPSRSRLLGSWGLWAGVPRDAREQPYTGRSVLQINSTFSFMGSFTTRGLFASPSNAAWVKIFVEEFDAGFNFRRAFEGPPRDILRVSPAYFSGADSFPRSGRTSAFLSLVAEPRMRYRVFVDVEAEVRGDGFGGFGGSSAAASVGVDVESVSASFYIDPGIL